MDQEVGRPGFCSSERGGEIVHRKSRKAEPLLSPSGQQQKELHNGNVSFPFFHPQNGNSDLVFSWAARTWSPAKVAAPNRRWRLLFCLGVLGFHSFQFGGR